MVLSTLSKSTSRRRADFFFGVFCFFFPLGPRCGLRAGALSLSNYLISCECFFKMIASEKCLLFPHCPLTTEIPKTVGEVRLVAVAFEAERGAEVDECWLAHSFSVKHRL